MKKNNQIATRLIQAFIIQALIISITAIFGVWSARYVIGDILIQRALEDEADHYWELYKKDTTVPLPNTHNLTGYFSTSANFPQKFKQLNLGFHKLTHSEVSEVIILHVSEYDGKTLYLEFDGKQVGKLALFFGIFPLTLFLIIIYLSGWIAYRILSHEVSPVIQLARALKSLDPSSKEFAEQVKQALPHNVTEEVLVLLNALTELSLRIEAFIIRERNFTRDASHELRSPITVIKIATDILLQDHKLNVQQRKTVNKIKNNASDMEELIETLLVLARESDRELTYQEVCVNDICKEEMERVRMVFEKKSIQSTFEYRNQLWLIASNRVLSVLIGNVIRNAFCYTDEGHVVVKIEGSELFIEDSGVGIAQQEIQKVFKPFERGKNRQRGGYGVGLTIVKMLSERFKWPISIESKVGVGTRVIINFPEGTLR